MWNPYSRGRLSPAKSEDRKGGEGKIDATSIFLSTFWKRKTDTHHLLIPASETYFGTHSVDMRLLPHVLEGVHHLVQSLVTARDLHLRTVPFYLLDH